MGDVKHPVDYTAYWAELLRRHKAAIAGGCISPAGARKVGKGQQPAPQPEEIPDANA